MGPTKYSGVKWIGEIPAEWVIGRIKHRYELTLGKMVEPDAGLSNRTQFPYVCAANIKWSGIDQSIRKQMHFSNQERKQYDVRRGDLLITEGGSIGTSCMYEEEFGEICYMQNSVIRARGRCRTCNAFLGYWLEFVCNSGYLNVVCNKATIAHYTKDKVGNTPLPLLREREVRRIVEALDKECSYIDTVSETLETQISILERYRASVIYETVTKGLDPLVPTKRSGIEWISKLPSSWQAKRFKYVAKVVANLVQPEDYPDLIEIDPENIEKHSGRLINVKTAGEVGAISAKQLFIKGQIIYSKIRPALNKVVIAPDDGLCSADMYPIETNENPNWLLYVMRSSLFVSQTALVAGMRVKMPKVNVEELGDVWIPVPPVTEQRDIAEYLDNKCEQIDAILETKRQQLDVLKRRRRSLVYEYVTGKRRVNGEE
jgi:type I restriction enzyme S subunit